MLRVLLLSPLLFLMACSAAEPQPQPKPPLQSSLVSCTSPRPQVCTMEYDPVCAVLEGDTEQDYSSPCNACAHDLVISYVKGSCVSAED
ncbi:hypothetical protein H2508_00850 [Parahaliea sp. F7430]|uniref:Kazal-like domain-containing protein n=1 Tax=Sediminihaliea albiluteola TaxID=2758564 RepID=A0A7W2TTI9_9GAMM|nr:hypothetical protein [Sediminihaliea albiluteola]MBA6411668.1 hypothetical protein [Sediminihaliea albiluteola]